MRGYKEEGTTTTPFDMVMLNDMDRYHLVIDVIDRVPGLASRACCSVSGWSTRDWSPARVHREVGDDPAHVRDWVWPG